MTVANLISFLAARGHTVDLYALRTGGQITESHQSWLRDHCSQVRLFRHGRFRMALGMLQAVCTGRPLQVGIFRNGRQRQAVDRAARDGDYDIVYTYYLRSAEATRSIRQKRDGVSRRRPATFLAMQLSQSLNTRRILENASNVWTRTLYWYESRRVRQYETTVWRDFDRSVLIGQQDLDTINEECRRAGLPELDNVVFGAHGTDLDQFAVATADEVVPNRIVFSGVMRTPTNVQAVLWFAQKVWPTVRRAVPQAEFMIVGREPTGEVRALHGKDGITVTGTVPDPAVLIRSATVCINPMQAGGGMQNKLLEYLACAKPVVATTVANEGIGAPADCVAVTDDPAEFAQQTIRLLEDRAAQVRLGTAARSFVEEHWSWEGHFLRLERDFILALEELCGDEAAEDTLPPRRSRPGRSVA
ncbi:glycosyltransferase [Blastococcus saxobsidens]|nr:glycosyltransferase family 4 protein [Blastococcus saxobsidens]